MSLITEVAHEGWCFKDGELLHLELIDEGEEKMRIKGRVWYVRTDTFPRERLYDFRGYLVKESGSLIINKDSFLDKRDRLACGHITECFLKVKDEVECTVIKKYEFY